MVVREALGYAEPRAEDYVRDDELSVVSVVELQLSKGYRPMVIERWLRVYGDSFRRIAETETDGYRTEVVLPLLEAGMSVGEMLDTQADFGSQMAPLTEQALLAIHHGQQEHVWTKGAVGEVEGVLERAGLYSRFHGQPAVSFLDLTGYTRLTEEQGDEAAANLAADLRALVRRTSMERWSSAHGGSAGSSASTTWSIECSTRRTWISPTPASTAFFCRFGYMLMADPAAALAETRRVLREGGRLSFAVWSTPERNPWASVPGMTLVELGHLPQPEPGAQGIFALADPARINDLVTGAGFGEPEIEEVEVDWGYRDPLSTGG